MAQPRSFQFWSDDGGQQQLFHCVSRVVERRFAFGHAEKEFFASLLRRVESFSCVQVVTWTILDNHFHILLFVPPRPQLGYSEPEILQRVRALYSPEEVAALEELLEMVRRNAGGGQRGDVLVLRHLRRFEKRMYDLSQFLKTLKQRFTQWFNRRHEREGTLWESRFKSVLVEGDLGTSLKVAAYVDLNAVRAGLVDDPAQYRWCGYGEALSGAKAAARRGIGFVMERNGQRGEWRSAGRAYRCVMFGLGEEGAEEAEDGSRGRRGISSEEVRRAWESGGKLPVAYLLRCRVRYFTDGLAIGSEGFVEEYFSRKRGCFPEGRRKGARRMRGGDWGEMRTFRELQVRPVTCAPESGSEQSL
jgi:REP element-mobilizing transposase RayT